MSRSAAKVCAASIVTAEHLAVTSNYTLLTFWRNPATRVDLNSVFNINADVMVPAFSSIQAPARATLIVEWSSESQLIGKDKFTGEIGGGRIYIKTDKGLVIKGAIAGGPAQVHSFSGGGSWARA